MNQIDVLLEQFDLGPMIEFEDLVEGFSGEESEQYLKDAFTEATNGTTKKNAFQRLWEFIKKCFRYIVGLFAKVVKWIKSLFTKKTAKSVDQIADECGIQPANSSENNASGENDKSGTNGKVSIEIPSNPRSSVQMGDKVDLAFKKMMVKFDKDKNRIHISRGDYRMAKYGIKGQGAVKGQGIAGNGDYYITRLLWLMTNPDYMQKLIDISRLAADVSNGNDPLKNMGSMFNEEGAFVRKWRDFFYGDDDQATYDSYADTSVTLDQIQKCQVNLNTIMNNIEKFSLADTNIEIGYKAMSAINQFANYVAYLQMAMNAFTIAIQGAYKIDAKYLNSVSDINQLDTFVNQCIDVGIPPKFIGHNAYLIASPKLRGDGSKGSANSPIWGQSRAVMFPTENDGVVYKIALSRWGTVSNRSELSITKTFDSHNGSSMIARALGAAKNSSVITSERLDTEFTPDDASITGIRNKLAKFTADNSIPIQITDIHSKNVGRKKDGSMAVLDYAWGERQSTTA